MHNSIILYIFYLSILFLEFTFIISISFDEHKHKFLWHLHCIIYFRFYNKITFRFIVASLLIVFYYCRFLILWIKIIVKIYQYWKQFSHIIYINFIYFYIKQKGFDLQKHLVINWSYIYYSVSIICLVLIVRN